MWHGGLPDVHMQRDEGTDTVPGHGGGGKFGRGKNQQDAFSMKRHEEIHYFFSSFCFFSSVKYPLEQHGNQFNFL